MSGPSGMERRCWAGIIVGDRVRSADTWWTVVGRDGSKITLRSQAGTVRTGEPDPARLVTMVPAPAPLRPDDGAERRAMALLGAMLGATVVLPMTEPAQAGG